ncbi:hypothetical protein QTP86_009394 [Hemibagrus guttatus]|nr:hypothetical protein QTP86_009394 [Hemibagrus guttatus]
MLNVEPCNVLLDHAQRSKHRFVDLCIWEAVLFWESDANLPKMAADLNISPDLRKADCPYYAKAELLADLLQSILPDFHIHKICMLPSGWESWLEDTCSSNGWKHKSSPMVWRELTGHGGKGMLLGGFSDFLEYVQGNTGDEEVMGKFGVKERNLQGQMVVDFAKRMDMAVVNTYFQKREDRVTYKSGEEEVKDNQVIRETGRKVLGVSSGRRKEDKETWWWNEEVQDSVQRKRLAKKKWDMDRTEENRQEYKELQRSMKREVSKAKQKAYDELYTRLDTREGEKDLYRLARQRDRDGKDVQQVRVIKDRDGRVLTSEESVQRRWKEYFEELMNEENEREK